MIPVKTPLTDFSFHLPGQPGEGEMPCLRRNGQTYSFWQLEEGDDVQAAEAVYVHHVWPDPVPVGLGFAGEETVWEELELGTVLPVRYERGIQTNGPLTPDSRRYLEDGGLFVVRIAMIPPPPVSVWLG